MLKGAAMVHARTAAPQRPRGHKSYPSIIEIIKAISAYLTARLQLLK